MTDTPKPFAYVAELDGKFWGASVADATAETQSRLHAMLHAGATIKAVWSREEYNEWLAGVKT